MNAKQKEYSDTKMKNLLVGDNVEIEVLNEQEATGTITRIEERNNSLIRPGGCKH